MTGSIYLCGTGSYFTCFLPPRYVISHDYIQEVLYRVVPLTSIINLGVSITSINNLSLVRIKNPRNLPTEGPVTVLISKGKWIDI
jgi:hypothetical protein